MKINPGYEKLAEVLQLALDQAQSGKGAERHANSLPFIQQPIMQQTKEHGLGGPAFQARKKILEAQNCSTIPRAQADLLGAIVYTAAMWLYLDSELVTDNKKNSPDYDELWEEDLFRSRL